MKILWVTNIPLPFIANDLKMTPKHNAGWLSGYLNSIKHDKDIEIVIAFPMVGQKHIISGIVGEIEYYSFYQPRKAYILPFEEEIRTSDTTRRHFETIINRTKPDILHVFGTEYQHSLVAIRAFNNEIKTVVSIQGLVSLIARHYLAGIPNNEAKRFAISSIFRGNLNIEAKRMVKRGKNELEMLRNTRHVIGRTEWDFALTKQINNNVKYHHCYETLRDPFYKEEWRLDKIQKYSIFISQANYPIKGLHFMLEALSIIKTRFPNVKLYIAGADFTNDQTFMKKIKISPYGKYIKRLIDKYQLDNNITFLGMLDESEMCNMFLKSNVFVLPSTCENSPNSLGEAMLLGVPSIAADVGGVKDFITHKENGFIYPYDEPYMLAHYVFNIFEDDNLAEALSKRAKLTANNIFNPNNNKDELKKIYCEITREN